MFLENDVRKEISVPWLQRNRICKLHNGSREQCVKSRDFGIGGSLELDLWHLAVFCSCILCELGQVTYLSLASIRLIVKWTQYFQISERLLVKENDRLGVIA